MGLDARGKVLGASYLDRRDVVVLPIAGLVWTPDPDSRYEMVFPKPKLAHRIYWTGAYRDDVEDWAPSSLAVRLARSGPHWITGAGAV